MYYPSIKVNDTMAVTTAKDILIDIASGKGPGHYLFALGFAGWSPGQLEYELLTDSWLIAPADAGIIFETPVHERWKASAALIGVDLARVFNRQGMV
jgi:putative transcriptional regulator